LPRQQAQPAERWSAAESTAAAEVRRQRRMLEALALYREIVSISIAENADRISRLRDLAARSDGMS